jgi:DNA helicase-2/ATP-dependent DNA helicase PcrA
MQNTLPNLTKHNANLYYKDGPMIIIAGAGSGKTRFDHKNCHLMSLGVDAFNILSLTFTNKAAREMKKRISDCGLQRS